MEPVLTLTVNPAVDRSACVKHITPDDKLRCFDERLDPGGGGINVCRVIQNLGGHSKALYTSGGPIGQLLQLLLDDLDMDHHPIPIQQWTRENFVVTEQISTKEFRFTMQGPKLSEPEWKTITDEVSKQIKAPGYLVISGSLPEGVPEDFYRQFAIHPKLKSTRIVLDTSGPALSKGLGSNIFLIKPNLRELRMLVDSPLSTEKEQMEAARYLVDQGQAENIVLSMGASGALVVNKDVCLRLHSPVVPIKSTVGAGDSMVGGIVHRLQMGDLLTDAAAYGVACGAAAVATPGTALGDKKLVESLLKAVR